MNGANWIFVQTTVVRSQTDKNIWKAQQTFHSTVKSFFIQSGSVSQITTIGAQGCLCGCVREEESGWVTSFLEGLSLALIQNLPSP